MARRIYKKELTSLLEMITCQRDDLKINDGDSTVYNELITKEILLTFPDAAYGVLFESETEFKSFLKQVTSEGETHPLAGVFKNETDFQHCLETAKLQISKFLKINEPALDYSFESLKIIDAGIKKQKLNFEDYSTNLYKYIICYIGMVIIKNQEGEWKLQYIEQDSLLEPYVWLKKGKLVDVFTDAYSDAYEDWNNFSVYTTAHLRIDSLN
ncbi:hypothetical protein KJS94_09620 [Flavihumibacter rivuli]|uniref:hypothetical protein n=1 Tax=Flavihumibacter rivuli TaxID=2838156 RepID=UPI001BDDD527|nr:hypothetical protein [Flavihumibacter rivuli]ULQ54895.1 hypothetical protein KJS94_09620 [Flavihumibacter rivuli]